MKQIFNPIFSSFTAFFGVQSDHSWKKGTIEDQLFDEKMDLIWEMFYPVEEGEPESTIAPDGFGFFLATQELGALMTHVDYRSQ